MADMTEREHQLLREYTEKSLKNVEAFRQELQMYLRRFTPERRKLVKRLRSGRLSSYEVLIAWQENLAPVLEKLEDTRNSDAFAKTITKYLYIEKGAQEVIDTVVSVREDQLKLDFINRSDGFSQRQAVSELVDRPLREVQAIIGQYINVTIASVVAKEQGVTVIDPHSSLLKKLRSFMKIRSERKRTIRRENKRLHDIESRLAEIEQQDGGMVGHIKQMGIDLVTTLAAKASYEKRLKELSKDDVVEAATRLEIFNEETRQIRHDIMNNISGSVEMSLESVHSATKTTDKLLLKIFDLTNTQKNNLLLLTKEHRELSSERDKILLSQKERLEVQG